MNQDTPEMREMLSKSGFSERAIDYYFTKPHMGTLENANQVTEKVGSCGDTMKVYLKVDKGIVTDIKYDIMGCAGSISAAMAAVDLIKGRKVEDALTLNDADIFHVLKEIPLKKHHCISLAVSATNQALQDYLENNGQK